MTHLSAPLRRNCNGGLLGPQIPREKRTVTPLRPYRYRGSVTVLFAALPVPLLPAPLRNGAVTVVLRCNGGCGRRNALNINNLAPYSYLPAGHFWALSGISGGLRAHCANNRTPARTLRQRSTGFKPAYFPPILLFIKAKLSLLVAGTRFGPLYAPTLRAGCWPAAVLAEVYRSA